MSIHALISRLDVSTDTEYEKLLSTFTLIKYTTTVPIKVLYLPGGYSLIDQGIAVQQMYIDLDVDELLYPDDDVQLITLKDLSKVQYGPV